MKKLLPIVMSIMMLMALLSFALHTASADTSGTCGNNLTWNFEESTGTLTIEGSGSMSYYSGKNYVPWDSYRAQITNVIFSEEQTTIAPYCFADCTALTEIRIPDSVVSIYYNAFSGCTALSSVSFGNQLESIQYQAFANCTSLTSVTFPDSLKKLEKAFIGCTSLASFTLPDGLEDVSIDTFADTAWWNAQEDGLVYGNGVLWGYKNTYPTRIRVQNGTRLIAAAAFYNCSDIVSLSLPAGLTYICASAFYGCTGLTSLVLPNSVTDIGSDAFSGCTGLQYIAFPDHLNRINRYAFMGCTGLTSISLHSVNVIEESAFWNCSELISADLGDSVLSMMANVFKNCTKLQTVTLPCSTKTVDDDTTFSGCTAIRNVNLTAGDGVMTISMSRVFRECYQLVEHIQLSEGIISVCASAFANCTGLTSVTLPNSITELGNAMFYGCTNLRYVNIPENVESIPQDIFWRCSSLQEIKIPEGVSSIGIYAFYYCENLQEIVIPESVKTIGHGAFIRCSQVPSFEIPSGVKTIESAVFQSCLGMKSFTVHKGLKSVSHSVFSNCTALTDVYYMGTQKERAKNLSINYESNDAFINARWHYLNVTGIELVSLPEKLCYQPEDLFDPTGGRIRITYDNGSTDEEELTADMVEAFDGTVSGPQELTVTYEDAQVMLTVYVGHAPGTPQRENEIPATCTDKGSYDEATYCMVCGEELSREHFVLDPIGHRWDAPTYEWAADNSTVTAKRGCKNDASHVETETVNTTSEVKTPATCEGKGTTTYTATFTNTAFETQTKDVENIDALGHLPGEPVHENEVPPTYTEEGHYDEVVYCKRCHAELSREIIITDKLPLPFMLGDVNKDEEVTAADASFILRVLVGLSTFDEIQTLVADTNRDGCVTVEDASLILRMLVGLATLG